MADLPRDDDESKEREVTPGGSEVVSHDMPDEGFVPPIGEGSVADEIEAHMERLGLKSASVFHELVSSHVHIDVHVVPPTEERPWTTLFTTGMSDLPMAAPPGAEECTLAELMLCLPGAFDVEQWSAATAEEHWPVGLLRGMARFPHEFGTWLWFGHTVPNGDPPEAFGEGTRMRGTIVLSPLTIPVEQQVVETSRGAVHLHALVPMFANEMQYKLDQGIDALLEKFDAAGVTEVLEPQRRSAVRRKLFGLF